MMKEMREALARGLRRIADMLDHGELEFMRAHVRRLGNARTEADKLKREKDALEEKLALCMNQRGAERHRVYKAEGELFMAERELDARNAILSRISGEVEKWREMSARATEEEYRRMHGFAHPGSGGTVANDGNISFSGEKRAP
jgi:hypothetical protein